MTVVEGTEYYEDFLIDNVLTFTDDIEDLHYHIYIPESYDGTQPYALYITLPGYGAYYFQGVAVNLKIEAFALEAKKYRDDLIIVAPQPNDWGEMSQKQIIGLTEYLISAYNIDSQQVYISGYSGGGETLSLVVSQRPELYAAALHVSSQWDGDLNLLVETRMPIYFVIGSEDEYYSSQPITQTYQELVSLYRDAGLNLQMIQSLIVLDVKEQSYFTNQGVSNQHAGGTLVAYDENIMKWLLIEHSH